MTKELAISYALPLLSSFLQDDQVCLLDSAAFLVVNRRQDSVRLLTVEFAVSLASMLTPEECSSLLSQHLRTMVADKSWRVRYMVSEHFAMVRSIHPTFVPLLDFC